MQPTFCSGVFRVSLVGLVTALVGCASQSPKTPTTSELLVRISSLANEVESQHAQLQRALDELTALRKESAERSAGSKRQGRSAKASRAPRPARPAPAAQAPKPAAPIDETEPAEEAGEAKVPATVTKASPDAAAPAPDDGETVADSSQEGLQLYYDALARIEHRQYEEALKSLHAFLTSSPEHVYADRAQYLIVKSHFLNKDYGLVLVAANILESRYPHSFKIPDALYKQALAAERMGQQAQAKAALAELLKRFPSHPLAAPASQALAEWSGRAGSIPLLDDVH